MRVRVVVVSTVIGAVALVPWLVWWTSLPDEVATHWSLGGDPNGHMSRGAAFVVLAGVACALAAAVVATARLHSAPVLAFVASTIASASLGTVVANSDQASWRDATSPFGFIVLGIVLGASAAILVRGETEPVPAGSASPQLRLRPGERVAWTGSLHSRSFVAVSLVIGAFGAVLLVVNPPAGLVLLFTAIVCSMFVSVSVAIGEGGVRIHGAYGFPRMTIPLDRIASATAIEVNPWQWGGWGYRGSLLLFKRAAWVLRRGPGLKLDLKDGKVLTVTVDDADEAASVLNGLRIAH